ncbi:MAG TPA: OPT/YSL family transporter, partial [Candidatus Elarobacter sp.]|nr:OPT/YSL family transporter [Candidatus Elarobacter sp.]
TYRIGHLYEQTGSAPAGTYLIDDAGAIRYVLDPGIGGRETVDYTGRKVTKLDSPKSQIMALVVDGILTQKLSWGLVLIGAFLAIAMEIVGIPSLPVAVGVYLPISTSATMFLGGVVRWLVERRTAARNVSAAEAESGPGVLFSSGLIAGGAITGVLLAAATVAGWDTVFNFTGKLGSFGENALVAIVLYVVLLSVPLYLVGSRAED